MASFRYEQTNKVSTNACINDTAISNPTKPKNITKGIKVSTAINMLDVNN